MSAYRTCKTRFRNRKVLTKLLEKRFGHVEHHDVPKNLEDFVGKTRPEKANLIVPRKYVPGASNDIGFLRTEDGTYDCTISQYDSGRHNQQWLKDLEVEYAEEVAKETATENECDLESREVLKNGAIRLRFVVNGGS